MLLSNMGAVDLVDPIANARVYFTPGDDVEAAVVTEIEKAKVSILVQSYSFSSVPISKALAAAHERKVLVRIISDRENETAKYTAMDYVAGKGIDVVVDDKVKLAHNKVMIIDSSLVLTGSFNWTKAAQHSNAENLLILHSRELAAAYTANWESRYKLSRPYLRRSDR